MKRASLTGLFFAVCISSALSQPDPGTFPVNVELGIEQVQGLTIGWLGGPKKYTQPASAKTLFGRTYSAKQVNYARQFIEWMQASYSPTGCLGDAAYYLNSGDDIYRKMGVLRAYYNQALPQMYGAYSKVYMFLKKEANGKFKPAGNYAQFWHIAANQLDYVSQAVNCISSPSEHYFTMPQYMKGHKGPFEAFKEQASFLGFDTHPNLQPYQHFYIPPKIIGDDPWYVVILTKNHQPLPFEPITIGEFLERSDKNLKLMYDDYYSGRTPPRDAWETAVKNLAKAKIVYQSKWKDIATLKENTQVSFIDFYNAGNGDLSWLNKQDNYSSFPVMRLKKGVMAASKTDQPQWIVVRWNAGMAEHDFIIHMMRSIMNNFNFDYVYRYFFGTEKVTTPYTPLNPRLK